MIYLQHSVTSTYAVAATTSNTSGTITGGSWQLWSADSRTQSKTLSCQARWHGTASLSNCRLHLCLPRSNDQEL